MGLVRQTLAAPVKLALQICAFFPKIDKSGLVKLLWKIGREPAYAGSHIWLTNLKYGIDAARETAEDIFKEYPSDQVAGMMGMIEFDEYNLNKVKDWLEKGKQCPETNPESLLWIELELSDHLNEYDIEAFIEKVLSRRDLSMNFTARALAVRAELFLRKRKWDDADAVLERIFRVQDVPGLRWMKWTVAMGKGDDAEAQKQLRMGISKGQKTVPNIQMALGWYYLGDIEKTRQYLTKAQQDGITKDQIIKINRGLGSLLDSQTKEAN